MADMSYETRLNELNERRTALIQEPIRELPKLDLSQSRHKKVLNLLNDSQYLQATLFGEFQLIQLVKSDQLHGLLPLEEWFDELEDAQRRQVIGYFNKMLRPHRLKLVWYSHGLQNGYQFIAL